jgi:hypothetical protein
MLDYGPSDSSIHLSSEAKSNKSAPVNSPTPINLSLTNFSPLDTQLEQVRVLEQKAEQDSTLFERDIEQLLRKTSLLDAIHTPSEYQPAKSFFATRKNSIMSKCGYSDNSVVIELDYLPPSSKFIFWREAATIMAKLTVDGHVFRVPAIEISAPGQKALDTPAGQSLIFGNNDHWSHARIVAHVAQYLVTLVDQALELTRNLNQGLPAIDLNPRFEVDVVAQTALALNLPNLPRAYRKIRLEEELGAHAEEILTQMHSQKDIFQKELSSYRDKLNDLAQLLKEEPRINEMRANYERKLGEEYQTIKRQLEPQIIGELKSQVAMLKADRDLLVKEIEEKSSSTDTEDDFIPLSFEDDDSCVIELGDESDFDLLELASDSGLELSFDEGDSGIELVGDSSLDLALFSIDSDLMLDHPLDSGIEFVAEDSLDLGGDKSSEKREKKRKKKKWS